MVPGRARDLRSEGLEGRGAANDPPISSLSHHMEPFRRGETCISRQAMGRLPLPPAEPSTLCRNGVSQQFLVPTSHTLSMAPNLSGSTDQSCLLWAGPIDAWHPRRRRIHPSADSPSAHRPYLLHVTRVMRCSWGLRAAGVSSYRHRTYERANRRRPSEIGPRSRPGRKQGLTGVIPGQRGQVLQETPGGSYSV